jgi:hypothetical protein
VGLFFNPGHHTGFILTELTHFSVTVYLTSISELHIDWLCSRFSFRGTFSYHVVIDIRTLESVKVASTGVTFIPDVMKTHHLVQKLLAGKDTPTSWHHKSVSPYKTRKVT